MIHDQQAKLVAAINKSIPIRQRRKWASELSQPHPPLRGQTKLDWLKQSPRSRRGQGLAGAFERIYFLSTLKVETISLPPTPLPLIKAYASKTARLKLTRFTRLNPATQTIGLTCFLQLTLWRTTDEAIEAWLMRVSEVRRLALERAARLNENDWQQRHTALLARIKSIVDGDTAPATMHTKLTDIVQSEERLIQQSRADRARAKLIEMNAQVRTLLRLIVRLPIRLSAPDSWLNQALPLLRAAYNRPRPALVANTDLSFLPTLWSGAIAKADDAAQQLRLLEAATLLQLQRSLRNASAVIPSSISYREYESLLIPRSDWQARRWSHLQLLDSSRSADRAIRDILVSVNK